MKTLGERYSVGNKEYNYNIISLRYRYNNYINQSDDEFIENIVEILHFAVFVCWVKEIPTDECLADNGIVHELVHLIKQNTRKHANLQEIRKKFEETLCL